MTEDQNEPKFEDERDDFVSFLRANGQKVSIFKSLMVHQGIQQEVVLASWHPRDVLGLERRLSITARRVELLQPEHLSMKLMSGIAGILDDKGTGEAVLTFSGPLSEVLRLPGSRWSKPEVNTVSAEAAPHETEGEGEENLHVGGRGQWSLPVLSTRSGISATLGIISPSLRPYLRFMSQKRPGISLTVVGLRGTPKEQNEQFVEIARSIFFDVDLRFNIQLGLEDVARASEARNRHRMRGLDDPEPVTLPNVNYSAEAAELYFYGRSARGMPLLEYLAFYQAIEYFYPHFTQAEMISRLRRALRVPGFDKEKDADLSRLIKVVQPENGKRMSEEEQLRAAIEHCVDQAELEDFLENAPEVRKSIESRDTISYVHVVTVNNKTMTYMAQVAKRLYDIRCRIVHSKSDGGPRSSELLLPGSNEVKPLRVETELIRFLAQRVIIARGTPTP